MMKQIAPTISVIVPVYKVEPYLRECIDSILAQTYTDFELILVDDGSPDNCGKICDEYAEKDSRIIVIHQNNRGLSAARNAGLDVMRGEYVAFVDSDDYVAKEYLERLYIGAAQDQTEISICEKISINDGVELYENSSLYGNRAEILSGYQASVMRYTKPERITTVVWGKLIHKDLLAGMRFPEGKIHEDQAVMPHLLYKARRVFVSNASLYYYRIREGSIEHSPFSTKRFDDIRFMDEFIDFLSERKEKELITLAKKRRQLRLAIYILQARVSGVNDIPRDCQMNVALALWRVRKCFSRNRYSWYLSKICPFLLRPYEYYCKIEDLITRKNENSNRNLD